MISYLGLFVRNDMFLKYVYSDYISKVQIVTYFKT